MIDDDKMLRAESIRASGSTKRATFLKLNPSLQQHKVYKNNNIEEYKRIEFTRYRVSSHNLMVETGRWSRTEREDRVCTCAAGGVQDEDHVLFVCELTKNIREKYNIQGDSLPEVFNEKDDEELCDIFYELSKIFVK